MKTVKAFVALLLAVALFVGGVYVGFKIDTFQLIKHETTYDSKIIKDQITELADLTTMKEEIIGEEFISDSKVIKGIKLPFTTKKLLVKYKGVVKVATDLSKVKVNVTKEDSKDIINVSLKKCSITDMYIDENRWEYLDQTSYVFNRLKPEDDGLLRDKVMADIEKQAKDRDLVGLGNEQAKAAVLKLLTMAYPEATVEVTVR